MKTEKTHKYHKPYYMPPEVDMSWTEKTEITEPPIWCSVDLRDGNQALIEPMSLEEKLAYFQMLVDIGFKEIEVGFPAASDTEYTFIRRLIEDDLIPEDVTIQVLTQARPHIIKKTFEAINGAQHAVVHLYNSTSKAQREQVFNKNKEEILQLAVEGAELLKELASEEEGDIRFEYSPESFHGTEVDYAAEVCNAVLDTWQPSADKKAIINIPSTVENAMPHVFASQIAYINSHLKYRDNVVLSVHPHNDRGCGVATSEVSILAGADRLEGTLFGNGERTGNADLVTVAMNMFSHGYDPGLDFSNMQDIVNKYEQFTKMQVSPREPYAGELVFTAFSGSHQDAIAKGLVHYEEDDNTWDVPYLPIDPRDVGRSYDSDIIRINSQSGKGGVAYILKQSYGITLPAEMREEVSYAVKEVSDIEHRELEPESVYEILTARYVDRTDFFSIPECHFEQIDGITAHVKIVEENGKSHEATAIGNGRINAVNNAIKEAFTLDYELTCYEEHALEKGSMSKACAYIGVKDEDGVIYWGIGINEDIIKASINALVSAVNRLLVAADRGEIDKRLEQIMHYIRTHSQTVSLEELAEKFYLSVPYLSKYIKKKSGRGFSEILTEVRMSRACSMLRGNHMPVKEIAEKVGYQNVEHFTRQFRKRYGKTPGEFRNS